MALEMATDTTPLTERQTSQLIRNRALESFECFSGDKDKAENSFDRGRRDQLMRVVADI